MWYATDGYSEPPTTRCAAGWTKSTTLPIQVAPDATDPSTATDYSAASWAST